MPDPQPSLTAERPTFEQAVDLIDKVLHASRHIELHERGASFTHATWDRQHSRLAHDIACKMHEEGWVTE